MRTKESIILEAAVLATESFNKGEKCVPYHNKQVYSMLVEHQDYISEILKAYTDSWHAANLAAS